MPKVMIQNDYGQQVRVIEWNDLMLRVSARKPFTGKEDLSGKFLVVRHTWGIGDILYSTPALRGLREKFPDVKIVYITSQPDVLKNNPDVYKILHFAEVDDLLDMGEILETKEWYLLDYDTPLKGGYDYKINLRPKPQINEYMMSLLKRDPKTLAPQEREFYAQASNAVITRYKMVALNMYVQHAFVKPEKMTVYYYPLPEELSWARNFLDPIRATGKKPIILIPQTSTRFKDYPNWREVIRLLPKNLVWIIMGAHKYQDSDWSQDNVFDCQGAFQLRQSFALCIEADLVCASDTGLFYPRAALGKPVVATYGPHDALPFLHYFPSAHGLRIEKLKQDHGSVKAGQCSVGCYVDNVGCKSADSYSPCLTELAPEVVAAKVEEVIL